MTLADVPYATPIQSKTPSGRLAFGLIAGGLGLIFLGGCFCIGILIVLNPQTFTGGAPVTPSLSSASLLYLIILCVIAFACLAGGGTMIFLAARWSLRRLKQEA